MNTQVNLAGVTLKNPVMVASGTFGSGAEYSEFVDLNRLGAVVTKGVANVPWPGNATPRVAEVRSGMLNAIGLQNPGIDVFCQRDLPFLEGYDTKVIVNVCGKTTADYLEVVECLGQEKRVDMLEINISCPNVKEGGIAFGQDPKAVEAITKEVKKHAKQPVPFLATVASVSPYIGLFGTVWGIMHAFMALSGAKQATLQMVAPGIAEALIATAIGLFAAIPAVMAYNRLSLRVNAIEQNYGNFIDEFTTILHRQAFGKAPH